MEFGNPGKFIKDRMNKYSPVVFQTSLMVENMVVMCEGLGNKFVFSNEDKLVSSWWPNIIKKILYSPSLFDNPSTTDLIKPPSFLHKFLQPEALKQYVEIMDIMARKHIDMYRALKHGYGSMVECPCVGHVDMRTRVGYVSDTPRGVSLII